MEGEGGLELEFEVEVAELGVTEAGLLLLLPARVEAGCARVVAVGEEVEVSLGEVDLDVDVDSEDLAEDALGGVEEDAAAASSSRFSTFSADVIVEVDRNPPIYHSNTAATRNEESNKKDKAFHEGEKRQRRRTD